MNKAWILPALAVFTLCAVPAQATAIRYQAILSGPAESPPNVSLGTGVGLITIDDLLNTMRVQIAFADLVTTSTGTTASHIHCCTTVPGNGTAIVATQTPTFSGFPIGVRSGTYDQTFDLGLASTWNNAFIVANGNTVASAEAAFLAGLAGGTAYLNIHSGQFPSGEIRGFIQAVPEPATITLLGLGLLSVASMARRRMKK